ncbi:MAG: CHAT domain-containing protein, partial [Flavobacteriaceae bacterium]
LISKDSTTSLRLNSSGATALKLLKNKAKALGLLSNPEACTQLLETVDLGSRVIDELKPGFKSEADKLLLIEEAIPLFESGMEAAYHLYSDSHDEAYIDTAFLYAEKSKSVLLLEVLLGTKANTFAKIPDSILQKERQLKSLIANAEKRLNRTKKQSPALEDELFSLRNAYRELSKTIESSYPAYFDLKYNTEVLTLAQVQQELKNGPEMLSYFYGARAIYVLGISEKAKSMHQIPLEDKLETLIRNIHEGLSSTTLPAEELGKLSYVLYQKIVAPALSDNSQGKGLLVLPDGLLNYIPFGALNTSADTLQYLIEATPIAYSNSATLLGQLNERKFRSNSVLGFAPSFEEGRERQEANLLLPLPHNTSEVTEVLKSFKGDAYTATQASLKNCRARFPEYGILHLATHAIYDDSRPEYSYLAFTPEEDEYLLYVRDLYQLELDAALVTLSACESGIGELKGGEGFMSLARGFFYSGASSIASTLWKINDASSATLMGTFYQQLAEGQTKDKALQNSKLAFLKANRQNALSHPYYWSAYVVSGNMDAIPEESMVVWYILGGTFIVVIGALIRKKLVQGS